MKIVLTTYSGPKRFFDTYIPDPGIAQISGTLRGLSIYPKIFDLNLPNITFAKFLTFLRTERPDLIGFKFFDTGFRGVLHLAEMIKKEMPECCLVAAGPHVTLFREHIFHQTSIFDFLVVGEGETAITDLVDYLSGKRSRHDIANVMFLSEGEVVQTETRLISDLDTLALPDWTSLNLELYFPIILLNDHRGCPKTCAFCAHNYVWGYDALKPESTLPYKPLVRQKSFPRICKETEHVLKNLGIRLFGFTDSLPLPSRLLEWSKFIISLGERVFWTSFAMINQFSLEDFALLKRSGCTSLCIGVETGDETLLRKIGKKYTREDVIRNFRDLGQNGIVGVPGFIIGFPGETIDSVKNTLSLIEDLKTETYVISPFILDPGSPIALDPNTFDVNLSEDWECKIILRDELNEFEIPYYTVGGLPNNQVWETFKGLSGYKGWDADRTIAESEYAAVLAAALNISVSHFVERVTKALASPDPHAISEIISSVWKAI